LAEEECERCNFFEVDMEKNKVAEEFLSKLSEAFRPDFVDVLKSSLEKNRWIETLKAKKYCRLCSFVWCYKILFNDLRKELDDENFENLLDEILWAESFRTHQQLSKAILKQPCQKGCEATLLRTYFNLADWGKGPSPQVPEEERNLIKLLRKQGFSIGDLAYIFQRSKATIHENLYK